LSFARTDAVTVANPISGPGTLTQNGSGVLTLSGDSTFTGPAIVAQGTCGPGAPGAWRGGGATTVAQGATLDLNGQNLGAEPVTVSGSGTSGQGRLSTAAAIS
jgi:autotransporter-associated beta strand protein